MIARWEQGVVAPSVETLTDLVRACGFDLPLELVRYDDSVDKDLRKTATLSPEKRLSTLARDLAREELADRG